MLRKNRTSKLILLSGGGTGGPSSVPLALAKAYYTLDDSIRFVFIGSNPVLEKKLFAEIFESLKIDYYSIPAGKWRRYFSLLNFLDIFKVIYGFFKAFILLARIKPELIISAGSFASVPLVWAGKILNIKIIVHQQDLRPGLANRLMAPLADLITVTFEKSLTDYGQRSMWIGNPHLDYEDREDLNISRLNENIRQEPLIFLSGGGGGSVALNELLIKAVDFLPKNWRIVQQTGKDKNNFKLERNNYIVAENFSHNQFLSWAKKADIIISRAGLSSLTEFSYLAKALIVVPIPKSHQEDNAQYFADQGAAIYLKQETLSGERLADEILALWQDNQKRKELESAISKIMPQNAALKGASIIKKIIYESA